MTLTEHMRVNNSERVVQTRGDSVQDVVDLLHEVCDKMEGRMSSMHIVHKATIRCAAANWKWQWPWRHLQQC